MSKYAAKVVLHALQINRLPYKKIIFNILHLKISFIQYILILILQAAPFTGPASFKMEYSAQNCGLFSQSGFAGVPAAHNPHKEADIIAMRTICERICLSIFIIVFVAK